LALPALASQPAAASGVLKVLIAEAWSFTDDGFFLNKGIDPFAVDNALQMEVDAVPEPSTWAMMLLGFALVAFAGTPTGLARTLHRVRVLGARDALVIRS
jgi:PEP-CTERM motif